MLSNRCGHSDSRVDARTLKSSRDSEVPQHQLDFPPGTGVLWETERSVGKGDTRRAGESLCDRITRLADLMTERKPKQSRKAPAGRHRSGYRCRVAKSNAIHWDRGRVQQQCSHMSIANNHLGMHSFQGKHTAGCPCDLHTIWYYDRFWQFHQEHAIPQVNINLTSCGFHQKTGKKQIHDAH